MHVWDIPPTRFEINRLSAWITEFFFVMSNCCTKVSILLVYRKITARSHSIWFIRLTWAAIAYTIAYTTGFILELLLVCRPTDSYWKSYNLFYTAKYSCANEQVPLVFSAANSVFSDIYASLLPMLLVRTLRLTKVQRLSLYALFSGGLVTAAVGIARMVFLVKVTTNYQPGPDMHDVTWYGWPLYVSNSLI